MLFDRKKAAAMLFCIGGDAKNALQTITRGGREECPQVRTVYESFANLSNSVAQFIKIGT